MRFKDYLQKVFVLLIILVASVAVLGVSLGNVAAEDQDNDGLDDDWEAANGYNNNSKDNVEIYGTDEKVKVANKDDEIRVYSEEEWDKKQKSDDLINVFLFVLLLSFGIFSLLAGIFTAYFGAGKSRAIGGVLLVLGLVVILVWVYFGILSSYPDDSILGIVHWEAARTMEAFITVLGAIIGAVVAIVMFLVAIMKS
jgi:hypothetical protein